MGVSVDLLEGRIAEDAAGLPSGVGSPRKMQEIALKNWERASRSEGDGVPGVKMQRTSQPPPLSCSLGKERPSQPSDPADWLHSPVATGDFVNVFNGASMWSSVREQVSPAIPVTGNQRRGTRVANGTEARTPTAKPGHPGDDN